MFILKKFMLRHPELATRSVLGVFTAVILMIIKLTKLQDTRLHMALYVLQVTSSKNIQHVCSYTFLSCSLTLPEFSKHIPRPPLRVFLSTLQEKNTLFAFSSKKCENFPIEEVDIFMKVLPCISELVCL